MPFKSTQQERFLWSQHPDVARRFADETKQKGQLTPLQREAKRRIKEQQHGRSTDG